MAFPTTSVLDDFNRSNEGPPPSSNWTEDQLGFGQSAGAVSSNQCVKSPEAHQYWNASTFGPDSEVYFTLVNGAGCELTARVSDPDSSNLDAYYLGAFQAGGTRFNFYRIVNNSWTQLGSDHTGPTVANGDKVGLEVTGTGSTVTVAAYVDDGGAGWTLEVDEDDTHADRITGSGYIGLSANDTIDDFGGGTVAGGFNPAWARGSNVILMPGRPG